MVLYMNKSNKVYSYDLVYSYLARTLFVDVVFAKKEGFCF
tara:strand:+ start:1014 stop:1133 length:120 start_codon:yes stop_codon:yes gene_type:complete